MKESEFYGSMPLLISVEFAFGKEIKKQVRAEQEDRCALCGEKVHELEIHHRVPENALRHGMNGIKGHDMRQNAVGLCHGENGQGTGSPDDCHEIADRKAIEEHLFFKNGRFVKLEEIEPEIYTNCYEMPRVRRSKNERRGKKHRKHYHSR